MLSLRKESAPPRARTPQVWLIALWILGIALALLGLGDTMDPTRKAYGANYPGDLPSAVVTVTALVAILWVVLGVSPKKAQVARALASVAIALLAVGYTFLASSHAGAIRAGVFVWSLVLVLATVLNALDTVASALVARTRAVT